MRGLGSNRRLVIGMLLGSCVGIGVACSDADPPASPGADGGAPNSNPGVEADALVPEPPAVEEDAATPSDAGDAGDADAPDTGLSPTFVYRSINHILSTGQSLSVGSTGTPPLSTTQPFENLMFSTGTNAGGANLTKLVPLTEGRVDGGTNPNQETMSSGLANLVTKMAREELLIHQPAGQTSHELLLSLHGIGGTAYVGLKKGTAAFNNGMKQTQAAFGLAGLLGRSYVVRAVTTVHGESDHVANNLDYEKDLLEWQSDYESGVKAINGQTDPIPMLQTQMSSWTRYNSATSAIPIAQLAAHVSSNGKVVLVGPKYHLKYSADGVHLTNEGYRHMGEDYAKVYRRIVLEGRRWEPVRPTLITRVGAVITVKFAVPSPPLVLDETIVTNPGGFGFEFAQNSGGPITIATATVTAPDTVSILLSAEPTGTVKRLRYGYTAPVAALAGPTTGARGNLRDSDATESRHGNKLFNWCVHFDEAVP
jgi:hypothetical protein